jgi:nucleotide-binding universal stress UspA family protein
MIRLDRILFPTDFSEYSEAASRYACAFAEQFDAELHLLHVLEILPSTTPVFGGGLALTPGVQESMQAAESELGRILDLEWQKGKRVVRATVDGAPFVEIIHYARENNIDLIVMGTHGRSGLSHAMIGSVAERVVRKSPCPVLTVRPGGHIFVMP